jgi:DNA-binding MarR family transcriptional regulator
MSFYSSADFYPDRSIGYLVRRAHQIGQGRLEPVFAAAGMTGTQWSMLVSIYVGRATRCAELARDLAHDKGATTRLIDQLEEKGWVTRERDDDDRRLVNLSLTPSGEAAAMACREQVIGCWNEWLADWDHAEVATLIELLAKLRTTLDKVEDGPCA